MADINDRLDRLQRRETFDRNGLPLRPDAPTVTRPAGVDDRLGEVLDAVATVVRKHPGLSVMVAVADGRAGRPVVRVTERDGSVETGVVVVGSGAPTPADQAAVVPSTERPRETVPPEVAYEPEPAYATGPAYAEPAYTPEPVYAPAQPTYGGAPEPVRPPYGAEEPEGPGSDGRHAARSWHDSLWSAGAQARFRAAEAARADEPEPRSAPPAPPGGTIPLPEDTSQVVSRLAQLLRDNPTLASSWSREAPE